MISLYCKDSFDTKEPSLDNNEVLFDNTESLAASRESFPDTIEPGLVTI